MKTVSENNRKILGQDKVNVIFYRINDNIKSPDQLTSVWHLNIMLNLTHGIFRCPA